LWFRHEYRCLLEGTSPFIKSVAVSDQRMARLSGDSR